MRNLLVPLDGSPFSEQALPVALGIARRSSAGVTLVAVYKPPIPPFGAHGAPVFDSRFDNDRRAELRRHVEGVRERAQASLGATTAEAIVLEGDPAETLERYAAEHVPSLVVLASHGSGGPNSSWLGSVTDRLLRRLSMPVLVVRLAETPNTNEQPGVFRRVLVTLDGSEESESAIAHAVAVAGNEQAEFTLLRVVSSRHPLLGTTAVPGDLSRDMGEPKSIAHQYLDEVAARLQPQQLDVRTAVRVDLQPARAIHDFVAEEGTDLIVMATHARGAIGRFLLGSVADKVVRTATVPVLLCRVEASAGDDPEKGESGGEERQPLTAGAPRRA